VLLLLAKLLAPQKMKRGADRAASPSVAATYAGSGVLPEVKEHTARVAVALQARGVPLQVILESLSDTNKKRTLLRHMAAIKGDAAPLSAEKGGGRPSVLADEQWAVVFGWVLRQQKTVDLETVQRWVKANFNVDVSIATVSRHKDISLSFQLVGRRGMTPGISRDAYV
jgi:hypothetical protein